jgi:hypothetical protein
VRKGLWVLVRTQRIDVRRTVLSTEMLITVEKLSPAIDATQMDLSSWAVLFLDSGTGWLCHDPLKTRALLQNEF